jgi:hypothetical protein
MVTNAQETAVAERLNRARREFPAAVPVLDALAAHPDPFALRTETGGLEFAALRPVDGRPNRAVLKLFTVTDGPMTGRVAVLFYKRSQVPFSRDRYSYGVSLVAATGAEPEEIATWFDFASRGFDPEARPLRLRQAVTFTVPD